MYGGNTIPLTGSCITSSSADAVGELNRPAPDIFRAKNCEKFVKDKKLLLSELLLLQSFDENFVDGQPDPAKAEKILAGCFENSRKSQSGLSGKTALLFRRGLFCLTFQSYFRFFLETDRYFCIKAFFGIYLNNY